MKQYISNWNLMRVLRLLIGLVVLAQGIAASEWIIIGLGLFLIVLPLLNVSTCSTNACSVPKKR